MSSVKFLAVISVFLCIFANANAKENQNDNSAQISSVNKQVDEYFDKVNLRGLKEDELIQTHGLFKELKSSLKKQFGDFIKKNKDVIIKKGQNYIKDNVLPKVFNKVNNYVEKKFGKPKQEEKDEVNGEIQVHGLWSNFFRKGASALKKIVKNPKVRKAGKKALEKYVIPAVQKEITKFLNNGEEEVEE